MWEGDLTLQEREDFAAIDKMWDEVTMAVENICTTNFDIQLLPVAILLTISTSSTNALFKLINGLP